VSRTPLQKHIVPVERHLAGSMAFAANVAVAVLMNLCSRSLWWNVTPERANIEKRCPRGQNVSSTHRPNPSQMCFIAAWEFPRL
jgi:hypothetical protein